MRSVEERERERDRGRERGERKRTVLCCRCGCVKTVQCTNTLNKNASEQASECTNTHTHNSLLRRRWSLHLQSRSLSLAVGWLGSFVDPALSVSLGLHGEPSVLVSVGLCRFRSALCKCLSALRPRWRPGRPPSPSRARCITAASRQPPAALIVPTVPFECVPLRWRPPLDQAQASASAPGDGTLRTAAAWSPGRANSRRETHTLTHTLAGLIDARCLLFGRLVFAPSARTRQRENVRHTHTQRLLLAQFARHKRGPEPRRAAGTGFSRSRRRSRTERPKLCRRAKGRPTGQGTFFCFGSCARLGAAI